MNSSLGWGAICLIIAAGTGAMAVPAIRECERTRYGPDAPFGIAVTTVWLTLSYGLIGIILVGNSFWPWMP